MEEDKLPLKRVEVSLTKFNEVAIPHHLDLLRQHKSNIIKYEERGEYAQAIREQEAARRVVSRLRVLLEELKGLRSRVRAEELSRFDSLTQKTTDRSLKAIKDYLESPPVNLPIEENNTENADSSTPTDLTGSIAHIQSYDGPNKSDNLEQKEAALRSWENLQEETRALREAWQQLNTTAKEQAEMVEAIATGVQVADGNTQAAALDLKKAYDYSGWSRWGCMATGAMCGVACGGPLGLAAGAKVGTVGALLAASLGYVAMAKLPSPRTHTD